MISARELGIVWSGTPQYWRWTSHPESRSVNFVLQLTVAIIYTLFDFVGMVT